VDDPVSIRGGQWTSCAVSALSRDRHFSEQVVRTKSAVVRGAVIGGAVVVDFTRHGVSALLAGSAGELAETAAVVQARGGTPTTIPMDPSEPDKIGRQWSASATRAARSSISSHL
jgi:hypothetical protein